MKIAYELFAKSDRREDRRSPPASRYGHVPPSRQLAGPHRGRRHYASLPCRRQERFWVSLANPRGNKPERTDPAGAGIPARTSRVATEMTRRMMRSAKMLP